MGAMSGAETTTSSEKNKRVILNIITAIGYQVVIAVFGLVLPRLYLVNFGSEVNGLNSTIKNIFAYLSLLEAGVGLSAQYSLYGPVAKGDTGSINGILSATRRFYLKTSVAYTAITVGFVLLYPLIIKTELDYFTVCCIILLYGVPGIVLFSLRGKYNAFLEVEGKKYVVTSLAMVTMVISNLLKLIFLMISDNLLLIQATYCVPSIVQVVFIIFYVRKHYQWIDWKAEPDHSALAQKNSVLIHQISSCLFSNTDTVIISFMCGMNYASVYAVFSLFFANFQQLITAFSNGVTFRFGQLYHSSREQFERAFEWYESLYYMFVFWVYTVITAFLMPIIRLYTSGIADASIYDSKKMLLLFAAWSILSCVEMPLIQLQSIAGKFDDTKGQAVREMVINILVSLILTWRIGIAGCLIGTLAALTYRTIALSRYMFGNVRPGNAKRSIKKVAVNAAVAAVVLWILGLDGCRAVNYFYVAGIAVLNSLWIAALYLLVNVLTNLEEYKGLWKELCRWLKMRSMR